MELTWPSGHGYEQRRELNYEYKLRITNSELRIGDYRHSEFVIRHSKSLPIKKTGRLWVYHILRLESKFLPISLFNHDGIGCVSDALQTERIAFKAVSAEVI